MVGQAAHHHRHRVHNDGHGDGVTFERMENGAVLMEIWLPPIARGDEKAPYFSDVMSSAEWVDTMAAMTVGDLQPSASDLAILRDRLAQLHERWRAELIRARQEREPDEPVDP